MEDKETPLNGETVLLPLPEISAPAWVDKDSLCFSVNARKPRRFIWGEGNRDGRLAVILDNPGAREDAQGAQFVCGARRTLRWALTRAGVREDEVYITFLFKCRPGGRYDREAASRIHLPVLKEQVKSATRTCIVALGDTVCKALYGPTSSVKSMRGTWHEWEGIPLRAGYHPLAARRRPNLLPTLVEDLSAAARLRY